MTIQNELNTLSTAISNMKTEIINKGQTVSSTDTVASLKDKIERISNKSGYPEYSKTLLNDIVEGTVEVIYDTQLDYLRPYCFTGCNVLSEAQFTKLKRIYNHAFDLCYQLRTLILPGNFVILNDTNVFKFTLIESGQGKIYVKDSLVNTYKADANWSKFSSQIYKVSDYQN